MAHICNATVPFKHPTACLIQTTTSRKAQECLFHKPCSYHNSGSRLMTHACAADYDSLMGHCMFCGHGTWSVI